MRRALKDQQKAFNSNLHSKRRLDQRHGGTHRPAGEEIELLKLREMQETRTVLTGILDVMRHQVRCASQVLLRCFR